MASADEREEWHKLPVNFWKRFQDLLRKRWPGTQAAFFKNTTNGGISEKTLRRADQDKWITTESLKKLAKKLNYDDDRQSLLIALGGKPPPLPKIYRDVQPKLWEEILLSECPYPYPPDTENPPPPFQPKTGSDIQYVAGWSMRIQTNGQYRATCYFARNSVWPEIEIVLYERVSRTEGWKRAESFGAVTSRKSAAEFRPQVEKWLITCWGKRVIARDAPWFYFVPEMSESDITGAGLLKLCFSAPNRQWTEGELPESTPFTGPFPVVQMEAVE